MPLKVLALHKDAARLSALALEKGNPSSLSDAGVAAQAARAGALAAYYNVLINLSGLVEADAEFVRLVGEEACEHLGQILALTDRLHQQVEKSLRPEALKPVS